MLLWCSLVLVPDSFYQTPGKLSCPETKAGPGNNDQITLQASISGIFHQTLPEPVTYVEERR